MRLEQILAFSMERERENQITSSQPKRKERKEEGEEEGGKEGGREERALTVGNKALLPERQHFQSSPPL